MLSMPMFIFTSSISALLGHTRCGLSISLLLLAILNTLFWVYANFFHKKTGKIWECSKSAIIVWYENGRWLLLGAQSINSERASLINFSPNTRSPANFSILHYPQLLITWLEKFAFGYWALIISRWDEVKNSFFGGYIAQIKLFAAASSSVWEMAVIITQELWFYFLVFHSISCLLPKHPHLVCVLTMI